MWVSCRSMGGRTNQRIDTNKGLLIGICIGRLITTFIGIIPVQMPLRGSGCQQQSQKDRHSQAARAYVLTRWRHLVGWLDAPKREPTERWDPQLLSKKEAMTLLKRRVAESDWLLPSGPCGPRPLFTSTGQMSIWRTRYGGWWTQVSFFEACADRVTGRARNGQGSRTVERGIATRLPRSLVGHPSCRTGRI